MLVKISAIIIGMNERGKYHKIDGNKIPPVGMILANKLIKITNPPMAVTAPNFLIVWSYINYYNPNKAKLKLILLYNKFIS